MRTESATEEAAEKNRAQGARWLRGILAGMWREYLAIAAGAVLINLLTLATPLYTMNVYDRVVPNRAVETLWALSAGVAIALVFDFLLRCLRGYLLDYAGARLDAAVSLRLHRTVLGMPMALKPRSAGAFASKVRELDTLRDFMASATVVSFIDLPFALLFIGVMAWIGGPVAFAPLLAFPVLLGAGWLLQRPMRRLQAETQKNAMRKFGSLVESVDNLETIKATVAEQQLGDDFAGTVRATAEQGLLQRQLGALTLNLSMFVQQAVAVAVIVIGYHEIVAGTLTTGGLIACSILGGRSLGALTQLAGLMARIQQAHAATQTLGQVMGMAQERADPSGYVRPAEWRGEFELRALSFAYPGARRQTLDKISVRFAPGERVAVLGRVGSGKTTLLKLLVGLYPPTEGAILFDGLDLAQVDPEDLRTAVAYQSQDVTLFLGTLRDNLALGRPQSSDDEMLAALDVVGMREFVSTHPDGLNMPLGEHGQGLSGGQRQSVVLARTLLRASRVLLLDEPTSAMDNSTETQFIERLGKWLGERMVIVVTHRPSLLKLVNRIVLIDGARVVANGPRDAVLEALNKGQIIVPGGQGRSA